METFIRKNYKRTAQVLLKILLVERRLNFIQSTRVNIMQSVGTCLKQSKDKGTLI